MSTVVVHAFLTVDGVAQAPGMPDEDRDGDFPHGGWQVPYFTEEQGSLVGRWHGRAGGLLLGRRTYDILAAHWPLVSASHDHFGIAQVLNALPKYVASRTVTAPSWQNSTVLGADLPAAVAELKRRDLGELQVIGSLDLVQTLIRHQLVDEYRLLVYPVLLGTGKRLFAGGTVPAGLSLVSSEPVGNGVTASVYRPIGDVSYGSFGL